MGVPESVQTNQNNPIFLENQFFVFLVAPKNFFWAPKTLIGLRNLTKKHKKLIFSKNWTYLIWLHTLGDSHSTQFQGPIERFSGQFIWLKICFQLGVIKLSKKKIGKFRFA